MILRFAIDNLDLTPKAAFILLSFNTIRTREVPYHPNVTAYILDRAGYQTAVLGTS
jgi:hypothetical protein